MGPKRFPARTVDAIRRSMVVGIRAGGGHHRIIAVWSVVVQGRVFIRSWRVRANGWYRAFRREPFGTLTVGDRSLKVSAIFTRSESLKQKVSQALAEKYPTPGSRRYVRDFARSPSRDATVELIPRRAKLPSV